MKRVNLSLNLESHQEKAPKTYLTSLQHAKRLSEGQVSSDIRSQQHPPIVHISRTFFVGIVFNLRHAKLGFIAHCRFPMRHQIRLAERSCQQFSPRSVYLGINHGENALLGEVGKTLIPCALQELGSDSVDFLECIQVCDCDLVRRNTDNGSILQVEFMDVKRSTSRYDGAL